MNTFFETGGAGSVATTHDWLTPPEILTALGKFDLDPCASQFQPWRTAKQQYTIEDYGLSKPWHGRVWCNPPYGEKAAQWLRRCADHRNAIAFVFARTDTKSFQANAFPFAAGMLFLSGRVHFRLPGGGKSTATAGAPSVLIAFDATNFEALCRSTIKGARVPMNTLAKAA